MAQTSNTKPQDSLTFPLRVATSWIERIGDAVQIDEWIVGSPIPIPGRGDGWRDRISFSIGVRELEESLSRIVFDVGLHYQSGEFARRFLLRTGTFRRSDWSGVNDVVGIGVPEGVREEVQRVKRSGNTKVYLLSVKHFYQEWELVRTLALIAGKLAEKANPLLVKPEVRRAQVILDSLSNHRALLFPRSKSHITNAHSIAPTKSKQIFTKAEGKLALAEQARNDIVNLYRGAFSRGIGEGQFTVSWGRPFQDGPLIGLTARSNVELAYLGLLANFSRGWKLCEREDCGNIFRVTDDKRKRFCSQYCGHLVSVRFGREKARGRKQRRRASRREGRR